jgi:hypothetical protein
MSRISKRPKSPKMPDMAALKRCLDYDPATGQFTWIADSQIRLRCGGEVAGSLVGEDWIITFRRVKYKSRRLAWYFVTGEDPGKCTVLAHGFAYQSPFTDLYLKEPQK